MANKPNTKSMYVRAVPRARAALKRLIAEMAVYEDGVTQEVFVTATWLWMASLEAESLHRDLEPHLKAIRETLEAIKEEPAETARPTRPVVRPKGRSTGKGSGDKIG